MSTWIIRGESVHTQTNTITYQLDMFEQFQVQDLKVGDKVFYSDSIHICCVCKIMSITIIDKITITMQIIDQHHSLATRHLRRTWGLKNLDIFKMEDIKILLLNEEEEKILDSLWKAPGTLEGMAKYEHLDNHLFRFKPVAEEWIGDKEKQKYRYQFFKSFAKEENLATMNWEHFEAIGEQLPAFQMPLLKEQAFGRQKASMDRYRQFFVDLLFGERSIENRLDNFYSSPDNRLPGFGQKSMGELLHYLLPNYYCTFTNQELYAIEHLYDEATNIKEKYSIGSRIYHYQKLINQSYLIEKYLTIVGRKTDLPIYYEISCFLRFFYHTEKNKEPFNVCHDGEEGAQYWMYTIPQSVNPGSFLDGKILTLHHGKLGDIRHYKTKQEVWKRHRQLYKTSHVPYLKTSALFQFCHEMKEGDYVFIRRKEDQIIAFGQVTSEYLFPKFPYAPSYRKVEWLKIGKWEINGRLYYRNRLINLSRYENTLTYLLELISE
ncbi:hypothetical protein K7887_10800 [Sutcliffiella horikoshii]|uniref:hypothetical protein n=1 Tax=Sutcliffiella horikoshii TaxID=79883 RepID=UPI001CBBCDD4|nr:hypothetical protein [Sutcliffiella horikoshii]UAL49379.1 hypothetical protein K7887_10800 [Sutcliffiella horikoshii]